jgi:RHS repeat-associated protein
MWLDPTGYYHARARAYDPRSGRFTSRDPVLGDELVPETWMPYAFGLNNPAVFRDPTGLMTLGDAGAASVAAQNISLAAAQSVRGAQVALGGATLTTAGVLKFAVATASLTLSAIVGIRVIPDDLEPWLETRPWGEYFELMMLQQLCGFQRALPKNRTLYIDVPIAQVDGRPLGSGVDCGLIGSTLERLAYRGGFRGANFADFLFSPIDPAEFGKFLGPPPMSSRTFLIGEIKLSADERYADKVQFQTYALHARNYSMFPAVAYVVGRDLYPGAGALFQLRAADYGVYLILLNFEGLMPLS